MLEEERTEFREDIIEAGMNVSLGSKTHQRLLADYRAELEK